jgi:ABC-type Na+ transport system ATPase subunit NatA
MFAADNRMILFSTHRFDMVEKVCSRAVILSNGRLAAEHRVSSGRNGDADSLEDLFVRVTKQADFAPVAREILDLIRHP